MHDRRRFCAGLLAAACPLPSTARPALARLRDVGPAPAGALPPPPARSGPEQGALWVQDNNMGQAGGLPPDFRALFTTGTADWAEARRFVRVYLLRSTSLRNPANGITDDFLRDAFLPSLEAWGIDLALDVVGAMGVACSPAKAQVMADEAAQIDRIGRLGGEVRFLSIQSVLSKPSEVCPGYGRNAGYDLRVADTVRYVGFMKGRYPGLRVGLVDAMVAKGWDYQPVYRQLVAALTAEGLTLDFIHLDFPAEAATPGWANARAAEAFVRGGLGIPFGLLYTSNDAGRASDEAFYETVMAGYRAFRAAGGRPDDLVLTSWHAHPSVDLPEDAAGAYPFMKLVLDFARLGGVAANPGA